MDIEKLTERINTLLQGRTAYWLAQQSGLSIPQCDKLIKGKGIRPSHEMLGKVARAFGLSSVDELLDPSAGSDLPPAINDLADEEFNNLKALWPRIPKVLRPAVVRLGRELANVELAAEEAERRSTQQQKPV